MVCQLSIYCFFYKLIVGSLILNIWCIENPYKRLSMWATRLLKFSTYSIIFCCSQWTIRYDFFEKYFMLYTLCWKCLATSIGLFLNRLHRFWLLKFFSSSSLRQWLFNLSKIRGSSSQIRSADSNVRKCVAIPNCLTIASTSNENSFLWLNS